MASPLESRVKILEDLAIQHRRRHRLVVVVPCKEGREQEAQDHETCTAAGVAVRTQIVPLTQLINH